MHVRSETNDSHRAQRGPLFRTALPSDIAFIGIRSFAYAGRTQFSVVEGNLPLRRGCIGPASAHDYVDDFCVREGGEELFGTNSISNIGSPGSSDVYSVSTLGLLLGQLREGERAKASGFPAEKNGCLPYLAR